jgi:hypothetical protein
MNFFELMISFQMSFTQNIPYCPVPEFEWEKDENSLVP